MREVKVSGEKSLGKMQHDFPRRRRQIYITTELRDWNVGMRNRLNNLEYLSIGVSGIRGFILPKLYVGCYFFFFLRYLDISIYKTFDIVLARSLSFTMELTIKCSLPYSLPLHSFVYFSLFLYITTQSLT